MDLLGDIAEIMAVKLLNAGRNPAFLEMTEELLYAMPTEKMFYAIGVFDHKFWCKKGIFEKVN